METSGGDGFALPSQVTDALGSLGLSEDQVSGAMGAIGGQLGQMLGSATTDANPEGNADPSKEQLFDSSVTLPGGVGDALGKFGIDQSQIQSGLDQIGDGLNQFLAGGNQADQHPAEPTKPTPDPGFELPGVIGDALGGLLGASAPSPTAEVCLKSALLSLHIYQ